MRKTRMAPGRVSYTRVATNWRAGRSKVINPGSVGSFGSQTVSSSAVSVQRYANATTVWLSSGVGQLVTRSCTSRP